MTDPRNWKLDWQRLSLEDREREYSPSSCIGGNYQPYIRAYADLSTAARRAHVPATVCYGTTERQTLDLFVPLGVAKLPVLVFFHGGYWQELSKEASAFAARQCLANVQAILEEAGSSLDRIVSATIVLADEDDFAGMNEEWLRWFPSNPPARQGAKLPVRVPGLNVSIAAIAEA